MIDPTAYHITISKIEDDDFNFLATVRELPDVECFGETWEEAYEIAIDTIEGLAELATKSGREFPTPIENDLDENYSGRITLRLPRFLHKKLAIRAEHEHVSLNYLISTTLAYSEGVKHAAAKKNLSDISMYSLNFPIGDQQLSTPKVKVNRLKLVSSND